MINIVQNNSAMDYEKKEDAKKGGLFVGNSHKENGIPAIIVGSNTPIEVEGGEAIINKEATAKHWEVLSKINQSEGNGVPIPAPSDFKGNPSQYSSGGGIYSKKPKSVLNSEKPSTYIKWRQLVNVSRKEITDFYNSSEGKDSGLTKLESEKYGIDRGRTSARWIMKMLSVPQNEWTAEMWTWAKKQISAIEKMQLLENEGVFSESTFLIWGHNPNRVVGIHKGKYPLSQPFLRTDRPIKALGGLSDGNTADSSEFLENATINGIVLFAEIENVSLTVIAYNTGLHERSLSLYNFTLINQLIKNNELVSELADNIIVSLSYLKYSPFNQSKIKDYFKSTVTIICNQNEQVFLPENFGSGGVVKEDQELIDALKLLQK